MEGGLLKRTLEVPSDIVTPMEQEAERRRQEEQAEKEERSKALAQARYERALAARWENYRGKKQAGAAQAS